MKIKGPHVGPREIDTVYFGGGTPSAISPDLLISLVDSLKENGFHPKKGAEITLEVNPGTLKAKDFDKLLHYGFTRFSVGAQTFNDKLLKATGRLHTSDETRETLKLLRERGVNYSADILFSLPRQSLDDLSRDLDEISKFTPPHISPYGLNIPEGHPYSRNRAPEGEQVEMFSVIERRLKEMGLERYEISNFAKVGFESRHNLIYWNDHEYWGLGMSSHSYLRHSKWGSRFWNPRSIEAFVNHIDKAADGGWNLKDHLNQFGEILQEHQALTDYFHISLRKREGLSPEKFKKKFRKTLDPFAKKKLSALISRGLLEQFQENYRLTAEGILLSNLVFSEFTFLKDDL